MRISLLLQMNGGLTLDRQKNKAILEAILFTMGESVEVERLASVIEEDKKTTRELLTELKEDYEQKECGITLMELEDSFQMCTRAEMYEYLIKIAKTPRKYVLTDTLLETLSIIAYKQPITRAEIEKIRGGELRSCGEQAGGVRADWRGRQDGRPGASAPVWNHRRISAELWGKITGRAS